MNAFWEGVVTIALAVVGLAVVATLVSRNAQTGAVIQAAASGFGNSLAVAQAPVSGASIAPDLSYPGGGFGGFSLPNFGHGFGS